MGSPNVGEFVQVRGRPWLVEGASEAGEVPFLDLACIADDAQGERLKVVWEAEVDARRLDADDWSNIGRRGVDDPETFSAYLRTLRWRSVTAADRRLFQAPFRAGIKLETYQLAPLRKALDLPRVNLLIADDVGLGKTIEAGLVMRELLLRRQIDFIIVAAPPGMTVQWQDELEAKFGLTFTIVDREYLRLARNRRGFAANPWSTGSQFIVSHRLLTDETYAAGLRDRLGAFRAKSLLILDEAHHAAPASGQGYAVDSQFTEAVRGLAPRFEHRLFLTATPHNGHSNSFSALLEMLDPQRFTRGIPVEARQRDAVMVRRLKEDLRKLGVPFPRRIVHPIRLENLPADTPELQLAEMLMDYGALRRPRIERLSPGARAAAGIVFSGLQQRLLSSTQAFAKTLAVHRRSLDRLIAHETERAARRTAELFSRPEAEPLPDDMEETAAESQSDQEEADVADAATVLGSRDATTSELAAERAAVDAMLAIAEPAGRRPDARIAWLLGWVRENMLRGGQWTERRLILFTEFEETRRWLHRRLEEGLEDVVDLDGRIDFYSGVTNQDRREALKYAFNAPPDQSALRILICTDAAREGINLQMRCHDLVHIDLPWNPSRLEQRNGRIDRKLQPSPEVYCRYFVYPQRPIDVVLDALVRKTETIRCQLGSMGKVIEDRVADAIIRQGIARGEEAFLAATIEGENGGASSARARDDLEASDDDSGKDDSRLDKIREELDRLRRLQETSRGRVGVAPEELRDVVSVAMARADIDMAAFPERDVGRTTAIALDPEHGTFRKDASWGRALDDLRSRPRRRRESLAAWRASAATRAISFEPPERADGSFDESVVHVHLEHRLVRRLLDRFISRGFQSGLDRAAILSSRYAEPRVVLLGRIALYGAGAARLHEELIVATARWREQDRDKRPLEPLGARGEETTLDQLADALVATGEVPPSVAERIRRYIDADVAALRPTVEAKAKELEATNARDLAAIGERESRALRQVLEGQRRVIMREIDKVDTRQLTFEGMGAAEAEQRRKDSQFWSRRLSEIEQEIESESTRIRAQYDIQATRLEPVGIVYLWPETN